jgi:hypothetical protein
MKRVRKFFGELFRRKVVRVVGAYTAIFWALVLAVAQLQPLLGFSNFAMWIFIIVGTAVIPFVAFLSWKYDIVPPQLIRDPKDVETVNPGLSWATLRHDTQEAGYVLLKWCVEGDMAREKRFFKPIAIGREPNNDIELPDQRVSRHHAVIWAEHGIWRIRDLDSANGTFIDHARVSGITALPQTCELRFHANGPTVSVFVAKSAETLIS